MRQPPEATPKAGVLNSWKEIAAYLGRGVRTVQRWEHDLQLPVRRPKGKDRSAVLAFPEELDAWLHETPVRSSGQEIVATGARMGRVSVAHELARRSRELRLRSAELAAGCHQIAAVQHTKTQKLAVAVRDMIDRVRRMHSAQNSNGKAAATVAAD